jgi:2-hydroxychromene-2-carboxylate isomerase
VSAANLEFWFEFGSTYSYLSAARIEDVAAAAGVPVLWEPLLLGPIFVEQGWDDSPFNLYPAKGRYMWRDMERLAAGYRIPFVKPSRFPRNGLLAARVACLAKGASERWLPEFVQAVFRVNFAEDREIEEAAEVRSILDSLGQPGGRIVEQAQAPENKPRLRQQTRRLGANRRAGPGSSGSSAPRASWSAANFSGETTVSRTPWNGPAPDRTFDPEHQTQAFVRDDAGGS